MKTRQWLPLLAVSFTVACAGGTAGPYTPTTADRDAIDAVGDTFVAAFNARDTSALAPLIAEDYERVGPDGSHIRGRAEFLAYEDKQFAMFKQAGISLSVSLADPTYQRWLANDQVVAGGHYTVAGGMPGGSTRGAYINYLVKGADGRWQIKNGLVGPETPPPSAPATPAK
jgi:uncharacterized protein (TIGR02246 family)